MRRGRCYFFFAAGFFAAGFLAGAAFFAGAAFLAGAAFFAGAFFAVAMEPPLPSWCDKRVDSFTSLAVTRQVKNATTKNSLHGDSAHLWISSSTQSTISLRR